MSLVLLIAAAAAGAGATELLTSLLRWAMLERAKVRAAEQKFSTALKSDDLTTLAIYLRDDLGEVAVGDYLGDAKIRRDVDRYLARLSAFVAAPPEEDVTVAGEAASPAPIVVPVPLDSPLSVREGDPPEIARALETLREDDVWSALARLRRDLESTLRAIREQGLGKTLGLGPAHHSGRFSVTTDVPPEAASNFRRFWRTASAAVHGQSVSMEEALQAIEDARTVYAVINRALTDLEA